MSMQFLRVMWTLGGGVLVIYSRSVEDQYHGRVGCNPLWHYPVCSLSTWRRVRRRRKPCGWIGYYNSLDSRLQNQLHYMKTTRLLYSLQIILEITGGLNTLIHGVSLWEKLWPMGDRVSLWQHWRPASWWADKGVTTCSTSEVSWKLSVTLGVSVRLFSD